MSDKPEEAVCGTAVCGHVIVPKNLKMALHAGQAAKEARKKGASDKDGKDKK
ncbi:hypothetical protein ACHAPT_009751 [Fusarium lateritium]